MRDRLRLTRVRLTLVYVAVFAVAAVVAGTGFWFLYRQLEYSALDASLSSQATAVGAQVDVGAGVADTTTAGDQLPVETNSGLAVSAVLVSPSGAVIQSSGRLADSAAFAQVARQLGPIAAPTTVSVGGHKERVLVTRMDAGNGVINLLIVGRPLSELTDSLVRVGLLLAVAISVIVIAAGWLGYWLAGRVLRPVRLMSLTARDLSEHDLHRRITLDLPPEDEIGELANTFNRMLARLEAAFSGLERFTADAAHELRAPLALMRTQVEVTLRRPRSPEEYQESHQTLLAEIVRLSRMADHLLLLARADAGALGPQMVRVDVGELLEEVIERWRPLARERSLDVEGTWPDDAIVQGDPDLLRRVLDNLIDNAFRHSPAGGTVSVGAGPAYGWFEIRVADNGPGVSPELRARLFERFARGDAARQSTTGGAGLGLALSAVIAHAHGGELVVEDAPAGGGAAFILRLPLPPRS